MSSPAWRVLVRVHSHGRCRRRLASPLSISTFIAGIQAGSGCPRANSSRNNVSCLLVIGGLLTAMTLTTTSWSSAQTHSWFSPHLGGSARGVRSGGDYGDLAILNCPTVAMSRSRNGSQMNGESYFVTGGTGERCPNVTLLLLRTAESLCRSTFLVRSERRPTSRIVSERRLWVESRRSQTEISMLPNGSAISCRPLTGSDEATRAVARRLPKLACAMAGQLHRLVGRQP